MEAGRIGYALSQPRVHAEPVFVRAARRMLDLTVSLAVLLVTSPLLLLVIVLVRLDSPGPAVFRQRRIGRHGRHFTVGKFRTMRQGADPSPHRDYVRELIAGTGERQTDGDASLFKLAVDDRITRVGRFLRRTSLDELPQLWNVVRGEMSLVGPRPIVPYELEHYPDWYRQRFAVKPGLTGLWQVSGRNERSYQEMVELDVEYIQRRNLWLDVTILFKTVWVVLTRKGAA